MQILQVFAVEMNLECGQYRDICLGSPRAEMNAKYNYPFPQFLLDERLEDAEEHVEQIRIVDDVNSFQA